MMIEAILYTNGNQESERLKNLLCHLDLPYVEYRLDVHFSQAEFCAEFGEDADYPQATLGREHVGNIKAILRYFKRNAAF